MMDVEYNGKCASSLGIYAKAVPDVPTAVLKEKTVEIPGADGTLILLEGGYKSTEIKIDFNFIGNSDRWDERFGLAAVISPIATAIINNLYQIKVKKLELEQNHKDKTTYYVRSIFENYLRYTGKCINRMISETEGNYGEYYFLALTYSPSHIADALISINASIHDGDLESATSQLEQLRPQIAELLQSL